MKKIIANFLYFGLWISGVLTVIILGYQTVTDMLRDLGAVHAFIAFACAGGVIFIGAGLFFAFLWADKHR
ncbi:MAG TPA: hypothetical protein VH413_16150 [Verrucomicrobiae bacterium]|nr:hypothetical protein [Verrucomicrobiae bacterium]